MMSAAEFNNAAGAAALAIVQQKTDLKPSKKINNGDDGVIVTAPAAADRNKAQVSADNLQANKALRMMSSAEFNNAAGAAVLATVQQKTDLTRSKKKK
mmetsp:Transcript_17206/g.34274  ORF Transcript_17206/g.34274 Transcript_17206/m.34274 type:complete len:98 (+) Transcript_17206:377-670(+)